MNRTAPRRYHSSRPADPLPPSLADSLDDVGVGRRARRAARVDKVRVVGVQQQSPVPLALACALVDGVSASVALHRASRGERARTFVVLAPVHLDHRPRAVVDPPRTRLERVRLGRGQTQLERAPAALLDGEYVLRRERRDELADGGAVRDVKDLLGGGPRRRRGGSAVRRGGGRRRRSERGGRGREGGRLGA